MRPGRLALVPAVIGLGVAVEWITYDGDGLLLAAMDLAVGVTLLAGGLLAWAHRPDRRSGGLMVIAGVAWFAGTLASTAVLIHRGPLAHSYLSYPTGRLRRRAEQAAIVAAYAYAISSLAADDVATLAMAAVLGLVATRAYIRTSGPARTAATPAVAATLAFAALLAGVSVEHLAGSASDRTLLLVYDGVILATTIALLVEFRSARAVDDTVTDLVVGLGEPSRSDTVRDRLARALGDPTLVVGYWIPERAAYVDDTGRPVQAPATNTHRTLTEVTDGTDPLAVLVYDTAVLEDPRLLGAAPPPRDWPSPTDASKPTHAARVRDLATSRRRIVDAHDAQRQRIEHELRTGTERRLERVSALLDDARRHADGTEAARLTSLAEELDSARRAT